MVNRRGSILCRTDAERWTKETEAIGVSDSRYLHHASLPVDSISRIVASVQRFKS